MFRLRTRVYVFENMHNPSVKNLQNKQQKINN